MIFLITINDEFGFFALGRTEGGGRKISDADSVRTSHGKNISVMPTS
jgi:hypothetical protein